MLLFRRQIGFKMFEISHIFVSELNFQIVILIELLEGLLRVGVSLTRKNKKNRNRWRKSSTFTNNIVWTTFDKMFCYRYFNYMLGVIWLILKLTWYCEQNVVPFGGNIVIYLFGNLYHYMKWSSFNLYKHKIYTDKYK